MIVYIYDNGLCDPVKNIGTARQFDNIRDVDGFTKFFVASMSPDVIRRRRFRIFVADDNVGWMDMDHWVLMDENISVSSKKAIEEIDIPQVAMDWNDTYAKQEKERSKSKQAAEKRHADIQSKRSTG